MPLLPDMRQTIERRQLLARNAEALDGAIEQKPPPAIGQAVVEHTEQTVEDVPGHRSIDTRSRRQPKRRDLQARRQERRIVLEQDAPVLRGQAADFAALSSVEKDVEKSDGPMGHVEPALLARYGSPARTSSSGRPAQ